MPQYVRVADHLLGLILYFPGVFVKAKHISQTKFRDSWNMFLFLLVYFNNTKKENDLCY